ncbi:Lrp/AsnC ligand binding domain-containing protein [Chloroflexota bacterium]
MARKAYVLIGCEVTEAVEATKAIRQKTGVLAAEAVTGNYDIIVTVEAGNVEVIAKTVLMEIAGVPGVKTTNTCIVIPID